MPIKNWEETQDQIIEMGINNYYMTGNLLDYEYFSKHYKLIAIDLSKEIELEKNFTNEIFNAASSLNKL